MEGSKRRFFTVLLKVTREAEAPLGLSLISGANITSCSDRPQHLKLHPSWVLVTQERGLGEMLRSHLEVPVTPEPGIVFLLEYQSPVNRGDQTPSRSFSLFRAGV